MILDIFKVYIKSIESHLNNLCNFWHNIILMALWQNLLSQFNQNDNQDLQRKN